MIEWGKSIFYRENWVCKSFVVRDGKVFWKIWERIRVVGMVVVCGIEVDCRGR